MEVEVTRRQMEREARAKEAPIVGHLPDFPGVLATMMLSPDLEKPLRALADCLLVRDYPGATISRAERELLATAVSAGNNCFYCMDTHGAFASALLQAKGVAVGEAEQLIEDVKAGQQSGLSGKMQLLLTIALAVMDDGRSLQQSDVGRAINAGATDEDVQLAVLIAAAFCMYNRMVDGFRARTPLDPAAHRTRAEQIARFGYVDTRVTAIPTTA